MEIQDNKYIMGYEPVFEKMVIVAIIDHVNREVRPTHGYFKHHSYGYKSEQYAFSIGYTYNNN